MEGNLKTYVWYVDIFAVLITYCNFCPYVFPHPLITGYMLMRVCTPIKSFKFEY